MENKDKKDAGYGLLYLGACVLKSMNRLTGTT